MSGEINPPDIQAKGSYASPLRVVLTRVGESPPYQSGGDSWLLDKPEVAFAFWEKVISNESSFEADKEHLIAILVDTKFRATGYHVVSVGSLSEAIAHPREIFRAAIVAGAYGFVLMHNHPSGDPSPSKADNAITKRLQDAADLLQVKLLDHVIAGDGAYFSFRENGILWH